MLAQFEVDEIIAQWPPLPNDIEQQLRDMALLHSRYLFYRRGKAVVDLGDLFCGTKSTVYYGFCTHCQTQSRLDCAPGHNSKYVCPACGSLCTAKKQGLGAKHLYDDNHFNVVQAAGGRLYIRQLYVALDYRADKLHPRFKYIDEGYRWVLSAEGCYKLIQQAESYHPTNGWQYYWTQQKSFTIDHRYAPSAEITLELLDKTYLKNNHAFDYLHLTRGGLNDLLRYAEAYAKRPNLESFVNIKTVIFAQEYVNGNRAIMHRIVNWKKARPHEMLRIQKEELPLFLQLFRSSPHVALCYQRARLVGQQLTVGQMRTLNALSPGDFAERPIREGIKKNRISKMLNYLERQLKAEKVKKSSSHYTMESIIMAWRDYLNECDQLEYDLANDSIYYPCDLIKQHNRTMKLVTIHQDEISRKRAAVRLEKLSWMTYVQDELIIRPAASIDELITEGKELSHCVASYASDYISGKKAIFFIRKVNCPDTSYFTLEIKEKALKVNQNRGYKNCAPPKEVDDFVAAWLQWLPLERKRLESLKRQVRKTA